MGTIIGFMVGYIFGTRAGREKYEELRDAWQTISRSEEFQGLLASASSVAGQVLGQGMHLLRGRGGDTHGNPGKGRGSRLHAV